MAFADVLEAWKAYGIYEFYLPFVLMFAIFYGLLAKSKIFGDEDKERRVRNINVIISVVAALFVMVSPVGVSMTVFFGTFFTQTMVILTTMLCFVMIFYMMIPHDKIGEVMKEPAKYVKYLVPFALLAVLAIFFGSGAPEIFGISFGQITLPWLDLSSQDVVTLGLIATFLIIVFYMTRGGKEGKSDDDEGDIIAFKPIRK